VNFIWTLDGKSTSIAVVTIQCGRTCTDIYHIVEEQFSYAY